MEKSGTSVGPLLGLTTAVLASVVIIVLFGCAPAKSLDGTEVRLSKLEVAPELKAGVPYDVALAYSMTGNAKIQQVCLYWSGEGPFCRDRFTVDSAAGKIRTRARTGNPNVYSLMGVVRYSAGGEIYRSNEVSARITVK